MKDHHYNMKMYDFKTMSNFFTALCIGLIFISESSSLKCYKCIALSCPEESTLFCNSVRNFVLHELPEIYYFYDTPTPFCPDPVAENADTAWETLKSASPASCGEGKDGEATCVVGRFRVTTIVTDVMKNVTSYGTTLGCAKRKLLEYTKTARLRRECSMVTSQSPTKDSLKHLLEIEHCPVATDMCMDKDYCISPSYSVVKTFRDAENDSKPGYTMGIIIGVVLLIAFCVMLLFLLGFKYN